MDELKDETAPFPPRICKQYDITQQERLAIKMDSGITLEEAEKQMRREEKIDRFAAEP